MSGARGTGVRVQLVHLNQFHKMPVIVNFISAVQITFSKNFFSQSMLLILSLNAEVVPLCSPLAIFQGSAETCGLVSDLLIWSHWWVVLAVFAAIANTSVAEDRFAYACSGFTHLAKGWRVPHMLHSFPYARQDFPLDYCHTVCRSLPLVYSEVVPFCLMLATPRKEWTGLQPESVSCNAVYWTKAADWTRILDYTGETQKMHREWNPKESS